jgi:hypothetical protein
MARIFNLFVDDFETIAEHAVSRMKKASGHHAIAAHPNGRVSVVRADRMPEADEPHLVGTYTRHTPVNHIEDDLIATLREIQGKRRAA